MLLFVGAFFLGQAEIERELTRLKSQETLNVGLGAGALSRNLDGIYRDLHFLEGHSALRDAVNVPTPQHVKHLAEDFLNFSHGKGIYDQVRWIDEAGMEIVRIDQVNGGPVAVSADKLQNKGQRYFFTDTIKLNPGEIFVSPLDLNIEQDKIEVPHKPMIRAATPLTDSRGAKRGIVILNYYGREMLDSFAEAAADIADHVMLVNREGYWLKSPKTDEEWGFMFKRPDLTLAAQAPAAWARISSADTGQAILPDGLWTWRSVHPLLPGQKSSAGAPDAFVKSLGEVEAKEYVWKTVAHLSSDALSTFQQAIWLKLTGAVAMLLGLMGVGAWKLAGAWTALASSEAEVRRLNIELEQKVNERTQELRNSVAELDKEVAEHIRDEQLRALEYAVARSLAIENDASSGVKAVMRIICEVKNWARSTYWRADEAAGVMRFAEYWDSPGLALEAYTERSRNVVFAPGVGLVGRVWQSGEPAWTADFANDPRVVQHGLGREIGVRGVFVFPVTSEGRTIGALAFFSREVREPDERLLALAQVIGSELGQFLQRKEAEDQVLRLNADLEKRVVERTHALEVANKELEAFSYSVSHDLRAPLRAIQGFSSLVEQQYASRIDEQGRDMLRRVGAGALKMGALIDDLLKLSQISRQEMRVDQIDLSALAWEVAGELQLEAPARKVEWVIAPQVSAEADVGLLRVVLQNLMGNAWKYSSKHESARIEFGVCQRNGRPACFVRDNGAGFDSAYADKLFGAFQRLHSPGEFAGTGIGLATVKRIIHRHGGEVGAESRVGEGATFWFTL